MPDEKLGNASCAPIPAVGATSVATAFFLEAIVYRPVFMEGGSMSEPIYKAFRVSFSEAWYRLSKDDQKSLIAKVNDALERVGGKAVIPLCDSTWSNERWEFFGVEMYPDMAALQKHSELLKAFDWARYHTHSTLIGTPATL